MSQTSFIQIQIYIENSKQPRGDNDMGKKPREDVVRVKTNGAVCSM